MADIEQNLVANVRQFQKAVSEEAPAALEDMSSALDDVVRDGERAGDRLERTFKEVADTAKRETRDMARDVEKNADRGFSRAGQAADAFKDEVKQNFAEVASSFDGSMQGVADGIQGILGGASVAIGGVGGLLVGLAGAAGGAFLQQWVTSTEAVQERVRGMYDDMLQSGQDYLSQDFLQQQIAELTNDQGRYNDALNIAKQLGVDISVVLAAEVTSGQERNALLAVAEERRREALASAKAGAEYTDQEAQAANKLANELGGTVNHYLELNGQQTSAVDKVNDARAAQELLNRQFSDGQRIVEDTGAAIDSWPEFRRIGVGVDTSEAERQLDELSRRRRTISVDLVNRYGQVIV